MTVNQPSFPEALKSLGIIELCLGADADGDNAFLYVNVSAERYAAYKDVCLSGDAFDPEAYGTVIAQGKGHPPASLVAEMKEKFGFWDEFEETMNSLGHALQTEINGK